MITRRLLSLVLILTAACSTTREQMLLATDPALSDLAWLAGSWASTTDEGTQEEHWTQPAGGTLIGMHREVAGDKTVFFENLKIERRDGGVFYLASPNGSGSTAFRMTANDGWRAVFENPGHNFPQRITYWREDDTLFAEIAGEERGRERSVSWELGRARIE